MKKFNLLLICIVMHTFHSCSKENENIEKENIELVNQDPLDDPSYYDDDPDCTISNSGNCCDLDGRKLVRPNYSYTYTYKGVNNSNSTTTNINWTVISGSITLISGQGTNTATFKFNSDFTTGKIQAGGLVNNASCGSFLDISKL